MFSELKISLWPVASFGSAVAAILAAIGQRLEFLWRAAKNRHDAAMLARLDDRMLSDIGLTRSDLRDAYAEPLWCDPTSILAKRAAERRAHPRRLGFAPAVDKTVSPSIVPEKRTRPPVNAPRARYMI